MSDREEASAFNFDKATKGINNDDSHDKGRKSMQEADPPGTQPDEEYNLVEDESKLPNSDSLKKICAFCQKKDEPLVGPFCKYED